MKFGLFSPLLSFTLVAARVDAQETQLRVMTWNMQSNMNNAQEADPDLLASQMRRKKNIDLWGLTEVQNKDVAEKFRAAAEAAAGGQDFQLILGKTGRSDRLAILFNAERLKLIKKYELRRIQVGRNGLRGALVAQFRGRETGQEFLFVVNHLLRGKKSSSKDRADRLTQSKLLNEWAAGESLPIIAVGDYNFDVNIDTLSGAPSYHELVNGEFRWVRPLHLVKTHDDDDYKSVLDFVFVANEDRAPGWSGKSTIMNRGSDTPAQRMDFGDDARNSDHRPVRATFTFADPNSADPGTIQVGSFNIELLGSKRKGRPKRKQEDLEELANRIAVRHDLEVVVFQEINTQSSQWATLKSELSQYGYVFHEGTTSNRNQFVVLAWDEDEVKLTPDSLQELPIGTEITNPDGSCQVDGLRLPLAGHFTAGEFSFWVVGVHLKSRSTKSSGSQWCNTFVRSTQCERIVEQVDRLVTESGDRDVLLVGDFNHLLGHESFDSLAAAGFTSQMAFLEEGSARGSYIKNSKLHESDDLIDHVFIRFHDTQEVVRRSGFVYPLKNRTVAERYIRDFSDHVPVWVSFRTTKDDLVVVSEN